MNQSTNTTHPTLRPQRWHASLLLEVDGTPVATSCRAPSCLALSQRIDWTVGRAKLIDCKITRGLRL